MEVALINPKRSKGRKRRSGGSKRSASTNPRKKKAGSKYQKTVGKFMKKGTPIKEAHRLAKLELGRPAANPRRRKSSRKKTTTSNPRKNTFFKKTTSNPKRRKSRKNTFLKKAATSNPKRRKRSRKSYKKTSSNPRRRRSRKRLPAISNRKGYAKGYRYYKPTIGKYVTVRGHRSGRSNPAKRRHKRRNPATTGGFFPTFKRIKSQFYLFPKKAEMYPSWKEVKAHPIFTGLGLVTGGASSAMWGGIGRLIGGKNVLISEVLGIAGNIIGFEAPARIVSLFNFKGSSTMVKGIRAGGIVVTVISALLGLVRVAMSLKKGGVSSLKPKYPLFGKIEVPKLKEVPMAALKAIGKGVGLSDAVTSGLKQGYDRYEPMGVSGTKTYDGLMDTSHTTEGWLDKSFGNPSLVERIRSMQKKLGLSDAQVSKMWEAQKTSHKNDELPGLGETYVPPDYEGGMSRDYVM